MVLQSLLIRRGNIQRVLKAGVPLLPAIMMMMTMARVAVAQTPVPANQPVPLGMWNAELRDERDINRQGYGRVSTIPVWSPLNDFELGLVDTVRAKGQALSPQELLTLYLLASGDVRTADQAEVLSDIAWDFLAAHDDLRLIEDESERGAALLAALHDDLFVQYDEAQSTVSGVLTTGTYNCISSALIYLALAQEIGLKVRGVLMPSHAFVEVTLADGRKFDVETTADEGFGMVRDARFFARQAEGWFESRGLDVPSFEDYQQRRTVSAMALGLENMWNQHLSPARADYPMRLRMAEIRGAIQPGRLDAQQNRLVYYYQESDFLRRQNNGQENTMGISEGNSASHAEMRWQLLRSIAPMLARFENHITDALTMADNQRIPLLLLQSARAQWLAGDEAGQTEADKQRRRHQALHLASQILASLDPDQREYESIRLDASIAVSDVIQGMMRDARFQPLSAMMPDLVRSHCLRTAICQQSLDQFHAAWSTHYWQQERWSDAINVARDYLTWAPDSPNRSVFEQNMESAYLNQFAALWQQELRDQAFVWLQNCMRLPSPSRCEARYQEVAPYFQ